MQTVWKILTAAVLIAMGAISSGSAPATTPKDDSATVEVQGVHAAGRPIATKEWTDWNKLLLVRSCIGEAGFDAVDECVAIAWVYATRAQRHSVSFGRLMRHYSAALKRHEEHRRPWLFGIKLDGSKPKNWPENLSWERHRPMLMKLLAVLDRWAAGRIANPLPEADHFGSTQDKRSSKQVQRWKQIETPSHFRNLFFNSLAGS